MGIVELIIWLVVWIFEVGVWEDVLWYFLGFLFEDVRLSVFVKMSFGEFFYGLYVFDGE